MLTIGVLGGVGPQATMDFERRLHAQGAQHVAPNGHEGYPPMVVTYFRGSPVLVAASGEPATPLRPNPALLQAAEHLGAVADFLVATSNFLHLFEAELAAAAGVPLLSMVDLALDEVERRGWRCVGVLGFGDPVVYTDRLQCRGLEVRTAPADTRHVLDRAIRAVLEARAGDHENETARAAVAQLLSAGADGVIAGCTEIPPLLGAPADVDDILNPLPLLAEAAAARACSMADAPALPAADAHACTDPAPTFDHSDTLGDEQPVASRYDKRAVGCGDD